ncbi:MAG: HAD family hydrolase, partial [Gemmatimonadota bacterium]
MRNLVLVLAGLAIAACAPGDAGSPNASSGAGSSATVDPLPSWNAGPSRAAIVDFVERTTTPG